MGGSFILSGFSISFFVVYRVFFTISAIASSKTGTPSVYNARLGASGTAHNSLMVKQTPTGVNMLTNSCRFLIHIWLPQ
jgi:hypothetical protein